jgi:hypothetical protein
MAKDEYHEQDDDAKEDDDKETMKIRMMRKRR